MFAIDTLVLNVYSDEEHFKNMWSKMNTALCYG